MNSSFWSGKKVFITGHTGFKGSWLSIWLNEMGATLKGYSLEPITKPSLYYEVNVSTIMQSEYGDIRDFPKLSKSISDFKPDVIFHLAAQALVRQSYKDPIETYSTNVMGTVHLLEAARKTENTKAIINVTSDKCYENREWVWPYRENDPMGGYDPYSSSKGCAELVSSAYINSFFNSELYETHQCSLASVRAGNVIGGGDWSDDRLIPDIIKAFSLKQDVEIRSPKAIRPWQHVLEPLSGYITLAEHLYSKGPEFNGPWNFGPNPEDAKPVEWIVSKMARLWGQEASWRINEDYHPHEAHYLKLDYSKSNKFLQWQPLWNIEETLKRTVNWYRKWQQKEDMTKYTASEIREYMTSKGILKK